MSYINYSILNHPTFTDTQYGRYNLDVYHQLLFLKAEIQNGATDEMQKIFPEGDVFLNVLYGLSWYNLIQNLDDDSPIYQEGIFEINKSLQLINSERVKAKFDNNLPLAFGAFYIGWSNYLLGQKLSIQRKNARDTIDIALFINNCKEIENAIINSESPYLESYTNMSWPADNIILLASVNQYGNIFDRKYDETIKNWIKLVKNNLDPTTGLIPHMTNSRSAKTIEGARGSSQSLILNFLYEIDPSFASEQYIIYKNLFLADHFGLAGIREYPKGVGGRADIDSGPVLFGIGGASTIVGQRAMGEFKNWNHFDKLKNSIDILGIPYTINSKRRYLFGQLAMADVFICWSNSVQRSPQLSNKYAGWRIAFHTLSLIFILSIILLFYKHVKK